MLCGRKRLLGVILISAGLGALFSLFINGDFMVGVIAIGSICLGIYFLKCCY